MLVYRTLHTQLFKGRTTQEIDYTEVAGKLKMDHFHVKVDRIAKTFVFAALAPVCLLIVKTLANVL